jgi:hypothetical protein
MNGGNSFVFIKLAHAFLKYLIIRGIELYFNLITTKCVLAQDPRSTQTPADYAPERANTKSGSFVILIYFNDQQFSCLSFF